MKRLWTCSALALTLLLGVAGCTYAPRYDDRPAYAYDYYYYPSVGVYFHLFSGDYYYRDGKHWVNAKVLPHHLYIDHRIRRPLVIRDRRPYHHHERHREQYRPPPDFRRDRGHDRAERRHNQEKYEAYRRR